MPHPLIARSPDLVRLQNEGFDIEIRAGHLVVHDIPYVNERKEVGVGTLVSDLTLNGDVTSRPKNHIATFAGDQPCDIEGRPITAIIHAAKRQDLGQGVIIDRSFSNKPAGGYKDYFHKITTYVGILSGPAEALQAGVTARTFKVRDGEDDSPFLYVDTASSRSGISQITRKLALDRAVIVGLGGTGAYTLDLLAKTPVRRIDLFDGDHFLQHNAFRGPGAPSIELLRTKPWKVDYWQSVYSPMHGGIVANRAYLHDDNVDQLAGADIVFLCVDAGPAKATIVRGLERLGLSFIDVGMGLKRKGVGLNGMMRTTYFPADKAQEVMEKGWAEVTSDPDNLYRTNIQIGELNALNACLAIIRYKQLRGFYHFDESLLNMLFEIADMKNVGDGEDE